MNEQNPLVIEPKEHDIFYSKHGNDILKYKQQSNLKLI